MGEWDSVVGHSAKPSLERGGMAKILLTGHGEVTQAKSEWEALQVEEMSTRNSQLCTKGGQCVKKWANQPSSDVFVGMSYIPTDQIYKLDTI